MSDLKAVNVQKQSTAIVSSILQRKCDKCRKDHSSKRSVGRTGSDLLHPSNQSLGAEARIFRSTGFEQDFSGVRVAALPGEIQTEIDRPTITASPVPESGAKTPKEAGRSSASSPHPFTAIALHAFMRSEDCSVPAGQHGASKVMRFAVSDFRGRPVRSSMVIDERLSRIEGPESLYRLLTPISNTSEHGIFNDCYRLYQPAPLPNDLRLKVEQNHLVDGEVISKNHITYTPNSILVCNFPRPAGQRDFEASCRTY